MHKGEGGAPAMNKLALFFLIFFSTMALAANSANYRIDGNISGIEIPGGSASSTDYNALTAFGGQVLAGTASSTDYNMQIGWVYVYTYDDNISPQIISVSPSVTTTGAFTSYTFSATISDEGIGVENCKAQIYLNEIFDSNRTITPNNAFSGTCSTSVSFPSNDDNVSIIFYATDYAGNASGTTQTAVAVRQDAPVAPEPGKGGTNPTTGELGQFCRIDDNCKVGLVCINEKCEYPSEEKPEIIDSEKLPELTGNLVTIQVIGIPIGILIGLAIVALSLVAIYFEKKRTAILLVILGCIVAIGTIILAYFKPELKFEIPETGNLATVQIFGIPLGIIIGLILVGLGFVASLRNLRRTTIALVGLGFLLVVVTVAFILLKL
mgnify:CR=1 FL=1